MGGSQGIHHGTAGGLPTTAAGLRKATREPAAWENGAQRNGAQGNGA